MNKTKIDYLTHTWNPLAMRCDRVSPACDKCWHLRMAHRLSMNPTIFASERAAYAGTGPFVLRRDELMAPRHIKKPAVIGVQFMGDLFHKSVSGCYLESIFNAMRACPQHKFLLLTKRVDQMAEWFSEVEHCNHGVSGNIWPGVTVENQARADERIPILLQIPAAVRFVSVEPMLSPVTFRWAKWEQLKHDKETDHLDGLRRLDWVIVGLETGPGARPAKAEWFNNIIEQCKAASIPVFVKKAPAGVEIIREFPR